MSDITLTITETAGKRIAEMQDRLADVADEYGHRSDEYVTMLQSFSHVLTGMLRLGGTITPDIAPLSLYGSAYIQYGMIFHAKYRDGGMVRDPLLGEWSIHS